MPLKTGYDLIWRFRLEGLEDQLRDAVLQGGETTFRLTLPLEQKGARK
jgi:hypothetical protein